MEEGDYESKMFTFQKKSLWNVEPSFLYPMTYIRGGWGEASKLRNGKKKEGEGTEKQLINPLKGLWVRKGT